MNLTDEPDDKDLNVLFEELFPRPVTDGSRVRDQRRALGITQKRLAAEAGVTFKDVSDFENDRLPVGGISIKILTTLNWLLSNAVEEDLNES